jgi:hypothetical protein
MASQAAPIDLFGRNVFEGEDLGFVAAASHVVGAWAMAGFAALMRRSGFGIERRLPVRRSRPIVIDLLMAGFAGISSHVLGRIRGRAFARRRSYGRSALCDLVVSLVGGECDDGKEQ